MYILSQQSYFQQYSQKIPKIKSTKSVYVHFSLSDGFVEYFVLFIPQANQVIILLKFLQQIGSFLVCHASEFLFNPQW